MLQQGNEQRLELWSFLVVQETRRTGTTSVSDTSTVASSMQPLEVVRWICSFMMPMKSAGDESLALQFLDVGKTRACWLRAAGIGMRDAGQAFEFDDHFLDHNLNRKVHFLRFCQW